MKETIQRLGLRAVESVAVFAAFFMVGVALYGFITLTPTAAPTSNKQILGVKTVSKLYYFPLSTRDIPIAASSQLNISADNPSNATYTLNLSPFDDSSYTFAIVQIKNDSDFPAIVKVSPYFSEKVKGMKTEILADGIAIPLIDTNGALLIPEIAIDPKTILPISLRITSKEKINNTSTLVLSFIRVE